MSAPNPEAIAVITNQANARVAAWVPTAQIRVLADAAGFGRWLQLQCMRIRASVPQDALPDDTVPQQLQFLSVPALCALTLDLRQPPAVTVAARDALAMKYLVSDDTQARVIALARQLALDEIADEEQTRSDHDELFQACRREQRAAVLGGVL